MRTMNMKTHMHRTNAPLLATRNSRPATRGGFTLIELLLVLVILGPTVAAYILQAWALRHAASSSVAAYTYVQPVLATFMAAMLFGERIRSIVIVAAAMIFTGVWIAGRRTM